MQTHRGRATIRLCRGPRTSERKRHQGVSAMKQRFVIALVAALLVVPSAARADVKPHALFGDGMVLQQDATCPIWGTADAGERVTVEFQVGKKGIAVSAVADKDGRWLVKLPKLEAG